MSDGKLNLLLLLLTSAVTLIRCKPDEFEYYAEYYGTSGSYAEVGESTPTTPAALSAIIGFDVRTECWHDHVTVVFPRNLLPRGLQFYIPTAKHRSQNCVDVHETPTLTTYSVALSCPQVINTVTTGSSRFYRHEALLIRRGTKLSRTDPQSVVYTVLLECEHFGEVGANGEVTFPASSVLRPEKRIFEHRVAIDSTEACTQTQCSYGDICLPEDGVDGYFCLCPGQSDLCDHACPEGYYGCSRNHNSTVALPRLKCIKNGWLCDNRYDCDLQDDEASCTEIWSTWSAWTTCSAVCGEGKRNRRRHCDVSFTRDPERCKLHPGALGCSRRCTKNKQVETQNEPCSGNGCSSVHCDRRHMTIAIPREPEMTSRTIESQMMLGGDPRCRPSYNDTHVIFVAPLNGCNMTSQVEDTYVLYRNEILMKGWADSSSIIIRDVGHSYMVKCRFKRRRTVILRKQSEEGRVEVAALTFDHNNESWDETAVINAHFASGDGEFEFKLNMYTDSTYGEHYQRDDYPLRKKLREQLYLAVAFHSEDEDLRVMIDSCQGTPTEVNDKGGDAYVFIDNGCPVDPTVRFLNQKQNHMDAFTIETFKFVDQSMPLVYFQCDVIVCDDASDDVLCHRNCSQPSVTSRHRRSASDSLRGHVVQGPIIVEDEETEAFEMGSDVNEGEIVHRKIMHRKDRLQFDDVHSTTDKKVSNEVTYVIISGICSLLVGIIVGVVLNRRRSRQPVNV